MNTHKRVLNETGPAGTPARDILQTLRSSVTVEFTWVWHGKKTKAPSKVIQYFQVSPAMKTSERLTGTKYK